MIHEAPSILLLALDDGISNEVPTPWAGAQSVAYHHAYHAKRGGENMLGFGRGSNQQRADGAGTRIDISGYALTRGVAGSYWCDSTILPWGATAQEQPEPIVLERAT